MVCGWLGSESPLPNATVNEMMAQSIWTVPCNRGPQICRLALRSMENVLVMMKWIVYDAPISMEI